MGIGDHYVPQGKVDQLLEFEKLDINHLYIKIKEILDEERKN
jgi:hypothetical protein